MRCEESIEIISWPQDAHRLVAARDDRRPALLLVEPGEDPPSMLDPLLDWVRAPADEREINLRVANLVARLEQNTAFETDVPLIDDNVVRYRDSVVVLSPVEARLMARLLADGRAVVSRDGLIESAWDDIEPDRNTVDVAMGRLRRKVEPVGITIRTVRSRGFLLELDSSGDSGQSNSVS